MNGLKQLKTAMAAFELIMESKEGGVSISKIQREISRCGKNKTKTVWSFLVRIDESKLDQV